jgi:hypothetical protein
MATGATCVTSSSQCTTGAVLACDGPEDCNTSPTDGCCASVNIGGGGPDAGNAMITGGNSKCGQCAAGFNPTGGMVMTKLCHVTDDCKDFSLTVPVLGKIDFNKCCSGSGGMSSGGIQFCAPDPSMLGGMGGYTCQ